MAHNEETQDNESGNGERSFTLSYSRPVRLARATLALVLAVAALANWVLAWVRFVGPVIDGVRLLDMPIRPLLAAHLGLLLTIWSVGLIYAFLPNLALAPDGLRVRTLFGWRPIPWTAISGTRTATFTRSPLRFAVVHGRWAWGRLWSPLVSVCVGAGLEPALLFTSDIRDFDPLLARIEAEVGQVNPKALFDKGFFSLPARLVFEPRPTLSALAEQSRDDGWPVIISAQAMIGVSAGLLVVLLLLMAFHSGWWWLPLVVVGAGAAEWGAGAIYLYALGAFLPGEVSLHQAALLYPVAQVPRALSAVPMFALAAAGLPGVAVLVGVGGAAWAVWLTAVTAQQAYRLPTIWPALAGASIQLLFQVMLLALVFS